MSRTKREVQQNWRKRYKARQRVDEAIREYQGLLEVLEARPSSQSEVIEAARRAWYGGVVALASVDDAWW